MHTPAAGPPGWLPPPAVLRRAPACAASQGLLPCPAAAALCLTEARPARPSPVRAPPPPPPPPAVPVLECGSASLGGHNEDCNRHRQCQCHVCVCIAPFVFVKVSVYPVSIVCLEYSRVGCHCPRPSAWGAPRRLMPQVMPEPSRAAGRVSAARPFPHTPSVVSSRSRQLAVEGTCPLSVVLRLLLRRHMVTLSS